MRGLSNNGAGLHKELGFLALLFLAGCTIEVPAPKQFDCAGGPQEWHCKSRATGKCIKNVYVEPEACEGINE